ncbi:MAG: DUF5615 family PIN-like protein [Nitrosotalea sp.]
MKKIVIDENMSLSNKELEKNPEFANTKHEVGVGAKDEKILEIAKKEGWTIVTKDKRFTLDLLIEGLEVWYHDSKGQRHKLKVVKID